VADRSALGSGFWIAATVCAFFASPCHCEASEARQPLALTDEQLERVSAGALDGVISASADGTGTAKGTTAKTAVTVTSVAGLGGVNPAALGQVSASAAGPMATASSTLSLLVIIP